MSDPASSEHSSPQHHLLSPNPNRNGSERGNDEIRSSPEHSRDPDAADRRDASPSMSDHQRASRTTSTGPGEPRSRSRSPRTRHCGASGTITEIPHRSRSPTPTRLQPDGLSPARNHIVTTRGMYSLSPPEITYDEVSTAPSSPTDGIMLQDLRFYSPHGQFQNKAVMVTPSGSLLAVNQSPLELRESTLTVNYPDCGESRLVLFTCCYCCCCCRSLVPFIDVRVRYRQRPPTPPTPSSPPPTPASPTSSSL
ncbi:hypothetical protein LSH36_68g13009 [Paralvinella palmiformis]|uniref:Uncharacterized protein n=1 Tax=Paralvinella palmiformis TaxID=53620 RepID=A0AAD9K3A9_9ANNE|nr:hypothetical protein LSH36_68g13009 [Paralvinella palmiformis]